MIYNPANGMESSRACMHMFQFDAISKTDLCVCRTNSEYSCECICNVKNKWRSTTQQQFRMHQCHAMREKEQRTGIQNSINTRKNKYVSSIYTCCMLNVYWQPESKWPYQWHRFQHRFKNEKWNMYQMDKKHRWLTKKNEIQYKI